MVDVQWQGFSAAYRDELFTRGRAGAPRRQYIER